MAARFEATRVGPRRRLRRLILLALVSLGLAPGTWTRTAIPAERAAALAFAPVASGTPLSWPAGLSVERVWAMTSPDPFFGGYSALLPLGEGRMRAFSDRGDSLAFTLPGHGAADPRFAAVEADPRFAGRYQDIESVAFDAETGHYWLGYEHIHAIRRFARDGSGGELVVPPLMAGWRGNAGAEAMVRLVDGRFLVLKETGRIGLLLAGDPLETSEALEFPVAYPAGYRPTDAALLPDGRVLVLMRRMVGALPPFGGLLAIGDPAEIADGALWRVRPLARLEEPLPRENYEALVVEAEPQLGADSLVLWLMSDDNLATFQRTLLVKLRWRP